MTLLIVDVQNSYKSHISSSLLNEIKKIAEESSEVFYLWDVLSGNDLYAEMPEEWLEDEDFYNSLNFITKEYGFFRSLMDVGIDSDDELILKLLSFMKRHGFYDSRDILEDEEIHNQFKEEFKNTALLEINLNDYPIGIPTDLIESLESLPDQIQVVGGGRNECLKEVVLLLKHMEKNPTIIEELTY